LSLTSTMNRNLQKQAARAVDALRSTLNTALNECGRPGEIGPETDATLTWRPGMTAHELAEEAMRVAAEVTAEDGAFRHGTVYCYACGSADCTHVRPPGAGAVFSGYESTGRPRWEEFFNVLLSLEDPRTERLFRRPPDTLARVVGRRRLISDQLVSFGKNSLTFRIWGQVIAGYFHIGDLRGALSAQVIETRDRRLHFQVIASLDVLEALASSHPGRESSLHRVYDALNDARQGVFSLSALWEEAAHREHAARVRERVFAILRHLAHSIERKGRQRQRRTAHAEVRGRQRRPVHKARDDLEQAGDGDVYLDRVRGSVVVAGKNGRVHVFSEQGRHITTLTLGRDEIERRCRRGRYGPAPRETLQALRQAATTDSPPASADV